MGSYIYVFLGLMIWGIIFFLVTKEKRKEIRKFKARIKGQKRVPKGKKLPIYISQLVSKACTLLFVIVFSAVVIHFWKHTFLTIGIVIMHFFMFAIGYGYIMLIIALISLIVVPFYAEINATFLIIVLCYITICIIQLLHDNIKNSLLFSRDQLQEKYNVENKYNGDISELEFKLAHNSNRIREEIVKSQKEVISLVNEDYEYNIGSYQYKCEMSERHHNDFEKFYYRKKKSFVEIILPYKFMTQLKMYFVKYGKEEKTIISNYSNVPTIICDTENKWYAEKVINDNVQLYISELAKKIGKYSIWFSDNKITVILDNILWSTWLNRTLMKKKSAKEVQYSINEIVNTLNIIEKEIRDKV